MNLQDELLTVNIGEDAKRRLKDLQTSLRRMGCARRETTPGKLLRKLVLMQGALSLLQEEFIDKTEK